MAPVKDVGASLAVVRAQERITQAQLPGQSRRFRFFGKETVRPCFDEETLHVLRANYPAQTFPSLNHHLFNRRTGLTSASQSVGRRKARNASTQYGHALPRWLSSRHQHDSQAEGVGGMK
jgi:hypothetical protein